jgi:hypothetical protein
METLAGDVARCDVSGGASVVGGARIPLGPEKSTFIRAFFGNPPSAE